MLIGLDLFLVNMAYAAISAGFASAGPSAMSWVLSGYAMVFAALLVPAGRLADRFGRRRLFRIGLLVFGAGAIAAATSTSVVLLIVARCAQGAGAALFVPAGMALLLSSSAPKDHKRMMSYWTAAASVASAVAPILSGLLTQVSWRLVFVVMIPIVAVSLAASGRVRESAPEPAPVPDVWGSVLLVLAVGALVSVLAHVSQWGLTSSRSVALAAAGILALAWFIRRARTHRAPAANLALFTNGNYTLAFVGILSYFVSFAIMVLGASLILTRAWTMNPLAAGALFAFGPAAAMLAATVVARTSHSVRLLAAVGATMNAAAALIWYFSIQAQPQPLPWFFIAMLLSGLAAGIGQVGFMTAAALALPPSDYAVGTAMINAARQIGTAAGVAILVSIVGNSNLVQDFHSAWIAAIIASGAAAMAALRLQQPAPIPPTHPSHPTTARSTP